MQESKIHVIDSDPRLPQMLADLVDDLVVLESVSDWKPSQKTPLLLVNYGQIVGKNHNKLLPLFQGAGEGKLVLYNTPCDGTRRMALYKLGAFRVFDEACSMTEIAAYVRSNLRVRSKLATENTLRLSGNLSELSLGDLIHTLMKEQHSGILKVITGFGTGRLFFERGAIRDAVAGSRKSDEAVLYMLTWTSGEFYLRSSELAGVINKIQLSTPGLLIRGREIRHQFYKDLKNFGTLNTRLKRSAESPAGQQADPKIEQLLELISDEITLGSLLFKSNLKIPDILPLVSRMQSDGLIEIMIEEGGIAYNPNLESGFTEKLFSPDEVEQLRTIIGMEINETGKLMVLGGDNSGKSDFIRLLGNAPVGRERKGQKLDISKIAVGGQFTLLTFGITPDQKITKTIEGLSEGLKAFIFLIDANEPDNFEYMTYVIQHLTSLQDVPWAAAISGCAADDEAKKLQVRGHVNLPDQRELLHCDTSNRESVKQLVLALSPTEIVPEPEETKND